MTAAPHAIITDIEGTTSSIAFVKDVLFPYARSHLRDFVSAHANDPAVARWLDATADEAGIDRTDRAALVHTLQDWIGADRKATPLKALQGMIWAEGYRRGAFRAHMYPDVAARLRAWHDGGIRLYVFSSGSVAAQKLLFTHSEAGDLGALVSGWFDTQTGPKRSIDAYARIAAAIGERPADCLFLSDVVEELDAAATAGMGTVQVCRPPATCPGHGRHRCVTDFDQIAW